MKSLNVQDSTAIVRPGAPKNPSEALFDFLNLADDGVEVRPIAGLEFGVKKFSIGVDFKRAAARGNQRERFNPVAEFENFCRQTDGFRRVVSNHAVFDRHFGFHSELLSRMEATDAVKAGQDDEPLKQPRGSGRHYQDDIKQKTKGSPRLVRISSLFSSV